MLESLAIASTLLDFTSIADAGQRHDRDARPCD
jgi:hypothetical protein